MNSEQIKKNKLDLEYHKYSQMLNAVFILLTTGVLGFLGSLIILNDKNKLFLGLGISAFVFIIGLSLLMRINDKLNEILNKTDNL